MTTAVSTASLASAVAVTAPSIAAGAAAVAVASPSIAGALPLRENDSGLQIFARAKHVIETLRTRYVCEGFSIDEDAAAQVLLYLASKSVSEDDDGWRMVVDFFGTHGQSLDWILSGDPGVMICQAAARSSRPLAAAAAVECGFPELEKRLTAVRNRWIAKRKIDASRQDLFEARVTAATGVPRSAGLGIFEKTPESEAYWETRIRLSNSIPAEDPADEHGSSVIWNEIHDELYGVCEEIIGQSARTAADLGVQAQAYALMWHEYWTGGDSADDVRAIVESICKFAVVEALPGVEVEPLFDDEAEAEAA